MADDGGLSRLQKRLLAIPRDVVEAVQPELRKQAHAIADTAEMFAPVDTGGLKGSISVTGPGRTTPPYSQPGGAMTVPENAVAVTVGDAENRHPHLVEYGTTKTGAQPFFWPAVRLHRKKTTQGIKNAVRRAVRKRT